jgi:hypothetical protein
MNELAVILLFIVALVVLAGLACWSLDWIRLGLSFLPRPSGRQPPDTPEEYRARRREPQFDVLAAYFGAPVPDSLQQHYRTADLLEQTDLYLADPHAPGPDSGHFIRQFLPADQKALEAVPRKLEASLFPFAEGGAGSLYCVRFGGTAREPAPVYLWNRRASSREGVRIADSLDEFLARSRRPGQASGADQ